MFACLIQVACLQEVATKTGFTVFAEKFTPQVDPTLEEQCPLGKHDKLFRRFKQTQKKIW